MVGNRMKAVAAKHSVFIVTEGSGKETDESVYHELCCKGIKLVEAPKRDLFYHIRWLVRSSLNVGRYANPKWTRAVYDILRKMQIDLVNVDLPMPCINLLPIQQNFGSIPIVINQQNIEFFNVKSKIHTKDIGFPVKLYAAMESAKLKAWEKTLYRQRSIKAMSFVSHKDLDSFVAEFGEKGMELFVSPIGTNLPDETEMYDEHEGKIIVFPASFDYPPNIHGAVWTATNVMPKLRNMGGNIKLYLVGREPTAEVRKLACEDIIVTGTVPDIRQYFRMADVFVVPIFFGGGVKTKLIEMGGYGKPVVSTTAGIAGTLYKHGEEVFVADTAEDFAEHLTRTLLNRRDYQETGERLRKTTLDHYAWSNIGKDYCDFLERAAR